MSESIVYCDDSLSRMASLPANSVDSCVTDPPYGLKFMGKSWDYGVPGVEYWTEVLRVLKPGGHLLSFGGTRTYHRMVCAIEDAGFEIRDQIQWIYGSGFPKSHNVSKGIDRAAGAEREVIGYHPAPATPAKGTFNCSFSEALLTATDAAQQWDGWGTALKPANEPIVVARKPLSEKTVAANVLRWGTGAINVDGCRVGTEKLAEQIRGKPDPRWRTAFEGGVTPARIGRWPANVIHDGSEEVMEAFPKTGPGGSLTGNEPSAHFANVYGDLLERPGFKAYADSGTAARFFYCAKAPKKERRGSKHPTVKPLALMRYLIRLVTPPGGTVLDPFAGSGTTGEAAVLEGMGCVLIEKDPEYIDDIKKRIACATDAKEEIE